MAVPILDLLGSQFLHLLSLNMLQSRLVIAQNPYREITFINKYVRTFSLFQKVSSLIGRCLWLSIAYFLKYYVNFWSWWFVCTTTFQLGNSEPNTEFQLPRTFKKQAIDFRDIYRWGQQVFRSQEKIVHIYQCKEGL